MKRKLLTAVIASLTVGAASSAFAGFPTIYGKINVTLNKYDLEKLSFPNAAATNAVSGGSVVDELDNWSLESNASRIGIRGDFDINSDLKAIYKFEYGLDVDNGTNANGREFTQRNIYGGFQSSTWGTIFAGKNDTPLKLIQTNTVTQSDIDRFNDMPLADIGTYLVGENRADNVIQYASPILFGGLEIAIAALQVEETGVASATSDNDDDGLASGKSIAITYGKSSWYAALAYDDNVASTDAWRAVGELTLGTVKLGAIYQTAERHEDVDVIAPFSTFIGSQSAPNPISEWDGAGTRAATTPFAVTESVSFKEQEGYVLNAAWKAYGPVTLKAQYGQSETTPKALTNSTNPAGIQYDDVKVTAIAVGADYKLNENAKLLAYYATVDTEGDNLISTKSTQDKTFAVGFDLKF